MNWDALGAIGEIVGALAVVISLGYLGVQIRNQNIESRAAAMHAFSVGWREASAAFTDPKLAELFIKANSSYDELNDVERLQLMGGMHGMMRVFEEAFDQFEKGRLELKVWEAINRQYSSYLAAPVFSTYWDMRKAHYHEDFQAYVGKMNRSAYALD